MWEGRDQGPASSLQVAPSPLQVNEYVDARDTSMGAWFEAQVVRVLRKPPSQDEPSSSAASPTPEEDVIYHVKYDE